RARERDALFGEFRIFAERYLPEVLTGVEVDRVERSPGRLDRRVAVGVEETLMTGDHPRHAAGCSGGSVVSGARGGLRSRGSGIAWLRAFRVQDVARQRIDGWLREKAEGRHCA